MLSELDFRKEKKKKYVLSMKRIRKLMPVRVFRLIDAEILLDGFITILKEKQNKKMFPFFQCVLLICLAQRKYQ